MESKLKNPLLQAALKLAEKGFRVFPIAANAKKPPLIEDFPNNATTDRAQIITWWTKHPNANIGVSTNGLCVLDIDPSRGGFESLEKLEQELGSLASDFRVTTPSGGLHVYFKAESPQRNTQDILGDGIDTRAEGGYVVGPGSKTPKGEYSHEA